MGLFDIFKKVKTYRDPQERAEWLASWCRQLICEVIMNNKSQFFKKEYINIENKRDLFVVAHEILKKKLNNEWGHGYARGFTDGFIYTPFFKEYSPFYKADNPLSEFWWQGNLFGSILGIEGEVESNDIFNKTLNIKGISAPKDAKKKNKLFLDGYDTAREDMKTFEHDGKRPRVATNGLYSFLKKK
ncbi:hypothetical protein N9T17_00415 [Candidatus Pelagibacter sp.]|nr:hypothetical protein [Candidatus Pelagibacter sp.]